MQIRMMRKGTERVYMSGRSSFVEDRGQCSTVMRSSRTNCYHIEDTPIGARPLVLIGTLHQIGDFLTKESRYGIVNNVPGLPNIYVRSARYQVRERYAALSASRTGAAVAAETIKTMAGILGDPVVGNASSAIRLTGQGQALVDAIKTTLDTTLAADGARGVFSSIFGMREQPATSRSMFCVEFTNVKGDDTVWVGAFRLNFSDGDLVPALAQSLCAAAR